MVWHTNKLVILLPDELFVTHRDWVVIDSTCLRVVTVHLLVQLVLSVQFFGCEVCQMAENLQNVLLCDWRVFLCQQNIDSIEARVIEIMIVFDLAIVSFELLGEHIQD